MEWSRFNIMFESDRNGWLLYNSGSNSFVQMDDKAAESVKCVISNPDMDFTDRPDLYFKLRFGGFLVENGADENLVRTLKMKRLMSNYSEKTLALAIAPTDRCNFGCSYCYEKNKTQSRMSDETEDKIIDFIKSRKTADSVYVEWYGGEPLLEFDRMQSLYRKIIDLGKGYTSCLITNGYLLTSDVIESLNKLKITFIQTTIDGSRESHDKRRYLLNGDGIYDKIVDNMDNLMNSDWKGTLQIRINLNKHNRDEFAEFYKFFRNRYPSTSEKSLRIYPGYIFDNDNPDNDMFCDAHEKGKFLASIVRDYGITDYSLLPRKPLIGGCLMTKQNAYMIGSDGEVYKCLTELGRDDAIIGKVGEPSKWNDSLMAEYLVGVSYLDDSNCLKCPFFPICDGGCHRLRLQNKRDGKNRDYCLPLKRNTKELLELNYEQKSLSK